VEAVRGLGESLVSGKAKPSYFELDRESLALRMCRDETSILPELRSEQLHQMGSLFLQVEKLFGQALDIEWAHDGNQLFLLQARPITHAHSQELRSGLVDAEKARLRTLTEKSDMIWTDFSIGDVLPEPSVLVMDSFQQATQPGAAVDRAFQKLGIPYRTTVDSTVNLYDLICGRPFINLSEYLNRVAPGFPLEFYQKSSREVGLRFRLKGNPLSLFISSFKWLSQVLVFLFRYFPVRSRFHSEFSEKLQFHYKNLAKAERTQDLKNLTDDQLWDLYQKYHQENQKELSCYHMMTDLISGLTQATLKLGLALTYGKEAEAKELKLTTGLDGNLNNETNLAFCEVAAGKKTVQEFIEEFGFRGNPDWDLAAPRWREEPEKIREIADCLAEGQLRDEKQFEEQKKQREQTESAFKKDLKKNPVTFLLARFFLQELHYYQIYSPLRETTQGICFLWVELNRRVLLELAERTGASDLIFYLKVNELEIFFLKPEQRGDLLEQARLKKRELKLLRGTYVPHIISKDAVERIGLPPEMDPSVQSMEGQIVCEGYVSGIARVVKNLDEAKNLKKGEILVSQFTDPAWTPLFMIAGGVIIEQGSSFSHGAIVAREIGLPALVNVVDVTYQIQTGQKITLDAYTGKVLCE
jgi:pyruvate,water dikinase